MVYSRCIHFNYCQIILKWNLQYLNLEKIKVEKRTKQFTDRLVIALQNNNHLSFHVLSCQEPFQPISLGTSLVVTKQIKSSFSIEVVKGIHIYKHTENIYSVFGTL